MVPYTSPSFLFIDATGAEKGKRRFTRGAVGCGGRSICGVLENRDKFVKIMLAEEFLESKQALPYDHLLISGMSMDKIAIQRVIKKWRKNHSGKIVLGGPITSDINSILNELPADLIVIGEGEYTIKELLNNQIFTIQKGKKLDDILHSIKGIAFRSSTDTIQINEFRPYSTTTEFQSFKPSITRIQDYPSHNSAKVYVECVRGCSNFGGTTLRLPDGRQCQHCGYCNGESLKNRANCPANIPPGCGFCSVPSLFGPARSRSKEQILAEIKGLISYGVKRIVLSAPDFLDYARDRLVAPKPLIHPTKPAANVDAIKKLLKELTSLPSVSKGKVWLEIENIKPSLFTEELAKIVAKYLPHSPINIGCETGDPDHAKKLGRPGHPKASLQAAKFASKYGLKPHVYFIHSLPGQSEKTVQKTIELIQKLTPYVEKFTIYRFRPLPLSAFGDFPKPSPAIQNKQSQKIVDAITKANLQKKREYKGQIVRAIIFEENFREAGGAMATILSGGPLIAVKNAINHIGEIETIRITDVITDRLLAGEIVQHNQNK